MKVSFDRRTDTLTVVLKDDTLVSECDEEKPGVVLDYDSEGHLVALEILDASERVTEAHRVDLHTMDWLDRVMKRKIEQTGKTLPRVQDTSRRHERIDPDLMATRLGAELHQRREAAEDECPCE